MEYQNIINLLAYTPKQLPKFRKKSWVKVNDTSSGTYKTNSYIKFRTIKLKSSLFLYMYIYIYIYIYVYIYLLKELYQSQKRQQLEQPQIM